jgi:hypothetical protein
MVTNDALKILADLTADDREMEELVRVASLNAWVAQLIYEARLSAGLTQRGSWPIGLGLRSR